MPYIKGNFTSTAKALFIQGEGKFVLSRFTPSSKSSGTHYWQRDLLNHRCVAGSIIMFYVFKSYGKTKTKYIFLSLPLVWYPKHSQTWEIGLNFFFEVYFPTYWVFQKLMSCRFLKRSKSGLCEQMDYLSAPFPTQNSLSSNSHWCPEHISLQPRLGMKCFISKFPLKMEMGSFTC